MVLLRNDIEEIRKIVADQISATILSEDFQNRLVSSLLKKIDEKLNTKIKKIEEDAASLRKEVKTLTRENCDLKMRLDSQEQYSRNRNIRIFGMKLAKEENPLDAITDLFQNKMNLTSNNVNIENCHRVEAKNPTAGRPPAILVQFRDTNSRAAVLKNRKILKNSGVAIKEDLTLARLNLLKVAVGQFSEKNAWCLHGNIYVKCGGVVHRIQGEDDLQQLKPDL